MFDVALGLFSVSSPSDLIGDHRLHSRTEVALLLFTFTIYLYDYFLEDEFI